MNDSSLRRRKVLLKIDNDLASHDQSQWHGFEDVRFRRLGECANSFSPAGSMLARSAINLVRVLDQAKSAETAASPAGVASM